MRPKGVLDSLAFVSLGDDDKTVGRGALKSTISYEAKPRLLNKKTIMNKKTIISFFLAFFAIASLAQVKSNYNLCLRDETTGEWLIGLFENYAIYDCEYWNYAEVGKDRVVLTKDGQRKEVRLKKHATVIDGRKHKTSVLISRFLPDYPVKDETPFDATMLDAEQEAVLRVAHRSGKSGIRVTANIGHIVTDDKIAYDVSTDSLGRFEKNISIAGQTSLTLFTQASRAIFQHDGGTFIPCIVEPAGKLLFFVDDVEGRIYVMGKAARMVNEFLKHPLSVCSMDYIERKAADFKTFVGFYEGKMRAFNLRRDSILHKHPMLSQRYKDFTMALMKSVYSMDLGQLRFNHGKVKREDIISEAKRWDLFNLGVPFMVVDDYGYGLFFDDICGAAIEKYCAVGSGVPFLQYILKKADEGHLKLSAEERDLIESELPAEAALDVPTLEELDASNVWVEGFYLTDTLQTLFESRMELFNEILLYYKLQRIKALDTMLDLPSGLREIAFARQTCKKLIQDVMPLNDSDMKVLRENVRHPYLLNAVLKVNDKLIAASSTTENAVAPENADLADLTDGEEIFRKIVEPYRGRFVYIDIWGTWCAPCRKMMEYVPQMKEELKDLDIVYLYLVSHSNEEAWKTAISYYQLTGENCVHYNLPEKQQNALQEYIGVSAYPTYKLVTPNGVLLPTDVPHPNRPKGIRNMIEKLKNKNN